MAWKFYDSNGNVLQLTGSHTLDSHTGTVDSAEIASGAIDLAHMSVNSINSDQYVDRSIDTVHIGLNQVTLAEMAGGTDGNLITYDTSGDPAYVVTGTATHVLTSNGADTVPTFQVASGGISAAQMMAYERPLDFIADTESHLGVAKGWCRIQPDGTLTAGDYNVASITDHQAGVRTIVWDVDFADAEYSVVGSINDTSVGLLFAVFDDNNAVGSVGHNIYNPSVALIDEETCVVAFGER